MARAAASRSIGLENKEKRTMDTTTAGATALDEKSKKTLADYVGDMVALEDLSLIHI